MHLVTLSLDSIQFGAPLPYALRDANGTLLAGKGYVIKNQAALEKLLGNGFDIFVDVVDVENHRAYIKRLHHMVSENQALGAIASTKLGPGSDPARVEVGAGPPDWLDLQVQASALLRDTASPTFLSRFNRLHQILLTYARRNPDSALFALFYLSAHEIKMYSATHAMLVSVICGLAARTVLNWSPEQEEVLSRAALTMNLGMAELQDRLAQQTQPISTEQRKLIDEHAARTVELLHKIGIDDDSWLDAIRYHHAAPPGPLSTRTKSLRMARLIQRADMLAARLAPRASRTPTPLTVAMQASYFDENRQVDEAGSALIKAIGIYAPGTFVRLSTNELAIVVRRGANTTTPKVAVVINRDGLPTSEPVVRDTALRDYRITASVSHSEVRVQINLAKMLTLTTKS